MELGDYLRQCARRLLPALKRAEEANLADALATAKKWSGGRLSYAEQRALDHPYAKRHAAPAQDAGLINTHPGEGGQGGALQENWETTGPELQGDALVSFVDNVDPVAELLEDGTPTMVTRPLPQRVELEIAPRVEQRRQDGLDEVFRP
jgi:hypothetical protein